MITESNVNDAFDAYLEVFNILAEKEDHLDELKAEVEDYKEGTPKHSAAIQKVRDFEKTLIEDQRNLRKAAIHLDRIKTLVQAQRN